MAQVQKQKQDKTQAKKDDYGELPQRTEEQKAAATERLKELDDILDDIEDVLESNAQALVNNFRQKGGQ